jgi:hypothetical protein
MSDLGVLEAESPKAEIMTPEGVMTAEWYETEDEVGGWRLEGVDHAQVVVLRRASNAVGVSLPEELTDPPCRTLTTSAHHLEYRAMVVYSQHVEGRVRDQRSPDPTRRNVSSRRLRDPSPGFGPFPDR